MPSGDRRKKKPAAAPRTCPIGLRCTIDWNRERQKK
jgi:hypothetical protein